MATKHHATANYKDLMDIGFPEHTAKDIIQRAKKIAIENFNRDSQADKNVIKLDKSPFDNRRLGIAPTEIVEELIGFSLSGVLESEKEDG